MVGSTLSPGFDMGVNSSGGRTNWLKNENGQMKMEYPAGLKAFHEAEAYHQDYAARHPDQPYIVIHDLPKVENLRRRLPELYAVK